jgi:hypothetical protein
MANIHKRNAVSGKPEPGDKEGQPDNQFRAYPATVSESGVAFIKQNSGCQ